MFIRSCTVHKPTRNASFEGGKGVSRCRRVSFKSIRGFDLILRVKCLFSFS
jgi:hypothetical protein